jgi:hypothetical protein
MEKSGGKPFLVSLGGFAAEGDIVMQVAFGGG